MQASKARRGAPTGASGPGPDGPLADGVVLSIEDLWVEYQTSAGPMPAVRGATLEIRSGESVALIGESGSGKTTLGLALLRLLTRTAQVSKGRALFRAEDGTILDLFSL